MDIREVSILHHAGIVLLVIYFFSAFNCSHTLVYILAFVYLYLVHERYVTRLQRKLQFEERKQANQRRVLSDSETVRWLNHAIENIWPICMEQIASQMVLLPIIPWFLEKYKPWTAKEAVVQHLYLGRSPPLLTEVRVLRQNNDDHLVLELGINFLTADDMSAILAVKLRKRLGFGMWAKLHITGMHVEGKVLVGVKFLRTWPFISRLRVCFVEPPYFQMTVKPIFTHGLDVTELPGIAGWLDKLLSIAFEQTLVEPNMLVVDVEKFISPQQERWFSMDEKDPVAYVNVEVIEGSNMKPSDLNGLADPYVKGHLGAYRFRTKIHKKTLTPKWHEEFKIPIISWESNNLLTIEVRDKDHFYDDILGDCSVNINDLRDGQRHDMWLPLENVKMGRLHLAITVIEDNAKGVDISCDQKDIEERQDSFSTAASKNSLSSVSSEKLPHEKTPKVEDDYEPIDVKGQKETGIWVHHPGSEDSRTWKPRRGSRRLDTEIQGEHNNLYGDSKSTVSGQVNNDSSSSEGYSEHKHRIRRGLQKIGGVFHRSKSSKNEDTLGSLEEVVSSPHDNIKSVGNNSVGLRFVMDDNISGFPTGKVQVEGGHGKVQVDGGSSDGSGPDSPAKGNVKDRAKSILRQAEKSFKQVISFKSKKNKGDSQAVMEKDTSDDESLSVQSSKDERIEVASKPIASSSNDSPKARPIASSSNDSPKPKVIVVQTVLSNISVDKEAPVSKVIVEQDPEKISSSTDRPDEEQVLADKRHISLSN